MVGKIELNDAVSMASAVLSNHNNFMSHVSKKKSPFLNPNPNPNPNFTPNQINHNQTQIKQNQHQIYHESNQLYTRYVNYDVSGYTKGEMRKLRSQLISELGKVRGLTSRIESSVKKRALSCSGEEKARKEVKRTCVASAGVMKSCMTVLKKLMSQKAGLWFNSPVDVVGMGLHDYHTVINRPMDLGTIKLRLEKGGYDTPVDFAEDVRLTFGNALAYNPKGHEVNTFAGQYLALFERWFPPILAKFNAEKEQHLPRREVLPSPEPKKAVIEERKAVLVEAVERVEKERGRGRPAEGKLPKPKAREVNKREMTQDEKSKLGVELQSLPEEKMAQVIHIVRKRNGDLTQDGDEIELDIEAVDVETLWELDRFVTNYKKAVSKMMRQGGFVGSEVKNVGLGEEIDQGGMSEREVEMSSKAKKGGGVGGGDVGEEDVDIGDEMPMNNFPPVKIDKDNESTSSSSSDDSSSSDSSGSSSGSDSDVDDAQSRDKESKNFQN